MTGEYLSTHVGAIVTLHGVLAVCVLCSITAWVYFFGWKISRRYFTNCGFLFFPRAIIMSFICICGSATLIIGYVCYCLPGLVGVGTIGWLSAYTDFRTHKLPNALSTVVAICVCVGLITTLIESPLPPSHIFLSVGMGALVWGVPLSLGLLLRSGIGMGDIKLAPLLGIQLELVARGLSITGLFFMILAAGVRALWVLWQRKGNLHSRIALGPFLIASTLGSSFIFLIVT